MLEFFGDLASFEDAYELDLYRALREFVASLDEGKTYRLVASELLAFARADRSQPPRRASAM